MKVPTTLRVLLVIVVAAAYSVEPTKKYYVFKLVKLNWYGAFIDCQSRGLQLATINSAAEQAALIQTMKLANVEKDWLWISGTDMAEQGSYVWFSTGKPVTFTKWGSGQPDNAGGLEHCIHIWNTPEVLGTWNDWQCGQKIFYICEDRPGQISQLDKNTIVDLPNSV